MNKGIHRTLRLFALLTVFLFALPVNAKPIHPFAEPIALGDHEIDIGAMLAAALKPTPWTLAEESDAVYLGNLSSKGIDVQVRISVVDNVLTLALDSATETGCGDNCKDVGEKKVLRWIVGLRRSITYELTVRVRDSLN